MTQNATTTGDARSAQDAARPEVPTGIAPLDERIGGLEEGGSYLVVGTPGPAKMVTALQFLHEGLGRGERGALVTNTDAETVLETARAWGLDMENSWRSGMLRILGFRDDFELRAGRTVEPEEAIEELDREVGSQTSRIVVDPGNPFLAGGGRTVLGSSFFRWAGSHPATVLVTFAVDANVDTLPASAEWVLHSTTGRLVVEPRNGGLFQATLHPAFPSTGVRPQPVSLALEPGRGLIRPTAFPARRGGDRTPVDTSRLLLVTLGGAHAELNAWASSAYHVDVTTDPLEAVSNAQSETTYGAVLVYAPRGSIRDARKVCQALRPLTHAAIVFASDDEVRASDRVYLLEAGADDCLTGGIDFRELSVRLRQAMASGAGARGGSGDGVEPPLGGAVDPGTFRSRALERSKDARLAGFTLIRIRTPGMDATQLAQRLGGEVRFEDGDLVCSRVDGALVLLQGARAAQARSFMDRFEASMGGGEVNAEVMSHPTDGDRVRDVLEELGGGTG